MQRTILIFILFVTITVKAQVNLVPNPSFERYNACPYYLGLTESPDTFDTVTDWYSPIASSPDYYAACSPDTLNGTPLNFMGYQWPRTGGAYMGLIPLWGPPRGSLQYREYISAKLLEPLVKDSVYLVQFYVSNGDLPFGPVSEDFIYVSRIGLYFSDSAIRDVPTYDPLPVIPQVENPETVLLTERENWSPVRGMYKAKGGERWITIGNFRENHNTPYLLRPEYPVRANDNLYAYVHIDDVSVRLKGRQNPTMDTSICSGSSISFPPELYSDSCSWNDGVVDQKRTFNTSGKWWITYYINGQALVADTLQLQVNPPEGTKKDTGICKDQRIILYAENAAAYLWNNGHTADSIHISDTGTYWVRRRIYSCIMLDTIRVTLYHNPVIGLTHDTVVCFADLKKIKLDAGAFQHYLWQPTGETTRTIYATEAMIYLLTVTDSNSCSASQQVMVDEECITQLFFPNAFSPNKDGANDEYEIRGTKRYAQAFSMQIYNRWGVQVFSSNNVYQTWDGTLNNVLQPQDVYVLTATYSLGGKQYEVKMNITLLR